MLLLIDLLGTGIPSIYLSRELPEGNLMLNKPNSYKKGILDRKHIVFVVKHVIIISSLTLAGFYIGTFTNVSNLFPNLKIGQTMAFLCLGILSILNIFNVSSEDSIFKYNWSKNPGLSYASIFSIITLVIISFII
jgi:magnesium-transporting ATPase (P-type)